jgi:hypothetical protein
MPLGATLFSPPSPINNHLASGTVGGATAFYHLKVEPVRRMSLRSPITEEKYGAAIE